MVELVEPTIHNRTMPGSFVHKGNQDLKLSVSGDLIEHMFDVVQNLDGMDREPGSRSR